MKQARNIALGVMCLVVMCIVRTERVMHVHAQATPIQHIVFIVKENHTFDSYFGEFSCGGNPSCVNGTTTGQVKVNGKATTIPLNQFQDNPHVDYPHAWPDAHTSYDRGAMDRFNLGTCSQVPYPCYQTASPTDIPNYWELANNYVLNDNAWSSLEGPSFPEHLYMLAAGSGQTTDTSVIGVPNNQSDWGCTAPTRTVVRLLNKTQVYPCFSFLNIMDEMSAAGVSWKYYGAQKGDLGYLWNNAKSFQNESTTANDVPWQQFAADAQAGSLPSVAWLTPPKVMSEHPFGDGSTTMCNGENWTVQQLNVLMQSPEWASTLVVLTWDDYGGYYDHVAPQAVDALGPGFRVPWIVISPYAYAGDNVGNTHVSHDQVEFSSVVQFIEYNWGLSSLGRRDALAGSLLPMLDFSQVHNSPLVLQPRTCPPPHRVPVAIPPIDD